MGSCGYTVIIKKKEVVAAVLPVQEHWLPMSNLDLLLPALDFGVFLCFKKSVTNQTHETVSTTSAVGVFKRALAQALVSFFALAGEVVQNRLGEPELLCNNRGVDFIHAYADLELKDIDLYHPDESVHGKLVPIKNQGVLSVQVTELKCGGVVIGCTFDHRVADAHSANMFLTTWAEIAQSKPMSSHSIPSFRRSLLTPRRPGHYHPSIDNMYLFLSSLPPPKDPEPITNNHLISRIYYIPAEEMDRLQSLASSTGTRRSKLESFSALLWKLIAEGGRDSKKICKLGVVVNGRERLSCRGNNHNHKAPESMQNYFGNVLTVPYAEASADELNRMPLNRVAESVHALLEGTNTEEHFSGLIDWVELHRPEQAVAKVYFKQTDNEEAVVVSSGQRFPISRMDFGWGRPDFGSYHFPWGGQTGYVMPMPSVNRNGDWVVYMHLLEKHLDLVEKEASHVFRPLTHAYLSLIA